MVYATRLFLCLPFLLFNTVQSSHNRIATHKTSKAHAAQDVLFYKSHTPNNGSFLSPRDTTLDTMRDRRVTAIVSSLSGTNDVIESWYASFKLLRIVDSAPRQALHAQA